MNIKLIFKYYWPHIMRYKKSGLLIFVGYGLGTVGTAIVGPILYKEIIDTVTGAQDPSLAGGMLVRVLLTLAVVIFVYNLFFRIGDYAMTFSQSRIIKDVSDDAFRRLQKHSYAFFANTFTGKLVARVKRYVDALETIHDQVIFTVWMHGLRLFFSFVVLLWFAPILAGIFAVWLVLYMVITILFTKRRIKKDLAQAEANSETTGVMADVITNVLNVKMFASHKKEHSLFADATGLEARRRRDAWNFQNLQFAFQGYFIGAFEFIGMFVAISLWINGSISAGTIILMQIYIFTSFGVVWDIGRNFTRIMRAFAEAKEMVDIFEEPPAVKDPSHPEECKISKGRVQVKNISFGYGEGGPVFRDLSFDIKPGEKVGLVGPSGAGKTTITKLLLRFADLQSGQILIDGQDISRLTQEDLRSRISYVPQDPVLFHRTLRENISYPLTGVSDEEIMRVAKDSHAHEFIKDLPKGYETLVGERGIKLSGGERQRVAIARAMIKDAPILVLDEATSSLDSISEKHIQDAFDKLMEGRTTLVIAHRLSTIQKMDRIVVFEDGKIPEEGTHKKLVAKRGLYYKLWKQQSHGFMGE